MKTSDKIRQLRIEKGLSQEALGELVGVKKAAINKYETGRVVNIKHATLIRLADALGVEPVDLLESTDSSTAVYGRKIIKMEGSSMAPALLDGDYVVLRLQSDINHNGQVAYVKIGDQEESLMYVKNIDHGMMVYKNDYEAFPSRVYSEKEIKELPVRILGIAVKLIRTLL
ncbi:MAG: helix-turn-helix domain-containing protein [Bacillota bacterium]|nr:helix-turn-helix domain-containing protein [Bacillota bacterium]